MPVEVFMMNPIDIFLSRGGLWIFYLVPAGVLSIPIWVIGRRRVEWVWWEFSILVLPFFLFISLDAWRIRGGLGWAVITGATYSGGVVPLMALIRVIVGKRINATLMASSLLIAACFIVIVIYMLLPPVLD